MVKRGTSKTRKKSSRGSFRTKAKFTRKTEPSAISFDELTPHDNTGLLKDSRGVADSLLQYLAEGDIESFREVLVAHLLVANKLKLAREAKIGRTTIYDLLDESKRFNPTLETIGAIFKSLKRAA